MSKTTKTLHKDRHTIGKGQRGLRRGLRPRWLTGSFEEWGEAAIGAGMWGSFTQRWGTWAATFGRGQEEESRLEGLEEESSTKTHMEMSLGRRPETALEDLSGKEEEIQNILQDPE